MDYLNHSNFSFLCLMSYYPLLFLVMCKSASIPVKEFFIPRLHSHVKYLQFKLLTLTFPGVPGITDAGKKKVLLLKGKEKEISHVSLLFLILSCCCGFTIRFWFMFSSSFFFFS